MLINNKVNKCNNALQFTFISTKHFITIPVY